MKKPVSFRLSPLAISLVKKIAADSGLSEAATIELIARDAAKIRGIPIALPNATKTPADS